MLRITIATCLIALAGCTPAPSGEPATAMVGMPNPAAEFCIAQGGKTEIRKTADGEAGYCHLPDGRVVDEWEYFRANHPKK